MTNNIKFLPFRTSAYDLYDINISYKEALTIYIKSNKKATNKNNLIQIIKDEIEKTKTNTCSICLDDITHKTTDKIKLSCGHYYHKSCFRENYIIYMDDKCSICRKPLNIHDREIKLKKATKAKYWKKIKAILKKTDTPSMEIINRIIFYGSNKIYFEGLKRLLPQAQFNMRIQEMYYDMLHQPYESDNEESYIDYSSNSDDDIVYIMPRSGYINGNLS